MAKELLKAIKLNGSRVLYKNLLHEKELQKFMEDKAEMLLDNDSDGESIILENGIVSLYEWKKYKIRVTSGTGFTEQSFVGVGEYGTSTYGTLIYKNCMGKAYFEEFEFNIISRKMSQTECDKMIEIVNNFISSLSYDFNQATFSKIERNRKERTDLNYHVYLLIMNSLQSNVRQSNILSNFEIIRNNPHRKMESISIKENIGFVSELSDDAVAEIMAGESELVECKKTNILAKKFAKAGKNYVPKEVTQEEIVYSFDNNENRFIKFFIMYCLNIIENFQEYFLKKEDLINKEQIVKNQYYIGILKNMLNNSFLKYVGEMTVLPVTSTVLTKKEGYRQLFQLYVGIKSIPVSTAEEDAKEIIENKSLDVLYENFCYFMIASMLCDFYGAKIGRQRFKVFSDEFSKTLEKQTYSNYFEFSSTSLLPKVRLHYNKNYTQGESYSKSYDPDISLEIFNKQGTIDRIYLFDSKFKANVFNDGDEGDDSTVVKMFKYDDISKMHAYKDAIKAAVGAFILYPGTENKIFYENDKGVPPFLGVGAFSLRPDNRNDKLKIKQMLETVLI